MNQDIQGEINSFICDDSIDTSLVQNIMLIHKDVVELHKYVNTNTFYIIYNYNSTREELLDLLRSKFKTLNRIGIAFHYTDSIPYFLNNEKLFEDIDLEKNIHSGNVQFIIDLINEYKVKNVDYLACNTLENDKYKEYYNVLLENTKNVIIGASNNKTGNLEYGGDWIMENTGENIQQIYFTSEIENYSSLLYEDEIIYTENNIIYKRGYDSSTNLHVYVGVSNLASGNISIRSNVISTIDGKSYEVTSIGENAFYDNLKITSVSIPESITIIDNNSFSRSLLTSITIPNSVKIIENNSFNTCTSLTSITIGNNVTRIGDQAFANCTSLISIFIPNSVATFDSNDVFFNCTSLTEINVAPNNPTYSSIDGILYDKNKTNLLLFPANNSIKKFTFPNSVTIISAYAFYKCRNLVSVSLTSSKVNVINNYSFSGCESLTYINISLIVNEIGEEAFKDCTSLTSINIPKSVTKIGKQAFLNCTSLTSIIIPNSVTILGFEAFSGIPVNKTNPKGIQPSTLSTTPLNNTNVVYNYFRANFIVNLKGGSFNLINYTTDILLVIAPP